MSYQQNKLMYLEVEQKRVKSWLNNSGFDCTTAPWIIARQYRNELKEHINILRANLE